MNYKGPNNLNPRKGRIIRWRSSGREEVILKACLDRLFGEIKTERETYSTDFIARQVESGFAEIDLPKDRSGLYVPRPKNPVISSHKNKKQ